MAVPPPPSVSRLILPVQNHGPGLRNQVLCNSNVFARLLAIPTLLDSPKRAFRRRRVTAEASVFTSHSTHKEKKKGAYPQFRPIMPASRFSNNLQVRSTFFVKK